MSNSQKNNKGGLSRTALIKLIRRLDQYEEWKRAVFIRDRFACQQCGRRNGRKRIIEADHIKSVAEIVKEYGLVSVESALTCEFLWSVDNGRTLCHSCHELTPSYPANFRKFTKGKRVNKHT